MLARPEVQSYQYSFAGRVKAKRVELAPRTTLSSLADRLNDGRLPDGEVVANLESEIRKLYEVGGAVVRVGRLLPVCCVACGRWEEGGGAAVPSGASADRDSCVAGTRPVAQ